MTTVLPGSAGGAANAVALQRDGKIVIAGGAKGSDGLPRVALARLNATGKLDGSFGSGGVSIAQGGQELGRNGEALGVALHGSTIVVAGGSRPDFQHERGIVARFNSHGSLNGSFVVQPNVLGGGVAELRAVAVGASGQIVAGGAATTSGAGTTPPVEGLAVGLSSGLGQRFVVALPSDALASLPQFQVRAISIQAPTRSRSGRAAWRCWPARTPPSPPTWRCGRSTAAAG